MDEQTSNDKEQIKEQRTANYPSRLKQVGISLILAIVLGGALFLVGWVLGRRQSPDLQAQLQQTQVELAQAEDELAESESRRLSLRALVALYQSAIALDQRNFGNANNYLDDASAALVEVDAPPPGADADAFAALVEDVETTNIDVARNLETQRSQVLDFAERLGTFIPDASPDEADEAEAVPSPGT